jgi:hypothetical protein
VGDGRFVHGHESSVVSICVALGDFGSCIIYFDEYTTDVALNKLLEVENKKYEN